MKFKCFTGSMLCLMLILLMVSCKTKPEAVQPEPPVEAPPAVTEAPPAPKGIDQAVLNGLNEARARAEIARQFSMDVDGPVYFPGEWDGAESQFILAQDRSKTESEAAYKEATGMFNTAADSFEAVALKALPLCADAWRNDVIDVRNDAIGSGAPDLSPDRFMVAEEIAFAGEAAFEAEDYIGAIEAAQAVIPYYVALQTGADAWNVREEIVTNNLASYDHANFDQGDESAMAALDAYDGDDILLAQDFAEDALEKYLAALRQGWKGYATDRSAFAAAERKLATDLKANVAVKLEFDRADAVFQRATNAFRTESYKDAASQYAQSESMFTVVVQVAEVKRQAAEEAIKAAEERVSASEETARGAEVILEGGAR